MASGEERRTYEQPKDVADALKDLQRVEGALSNMAIDTLSLVVDSNEDARDSYVYGGDLVYAGDRRVLLLPGAWSSLMRILQMPHSYVAKLPGDLRRALVAYELRHSDVCSLWLLLRDQRCLPYPALCLAVSDGSKPALLLTEVLQYIDQELNEGIHVAGYEWSPERAVLRLLIEGPEVEPKPGVAVRAGVSITVSPAGTSETTVEILLWTLACSNGMIVREKEREQTLEGSKEAILTNLVDEIRRVRGQLGGTLKKLESIANEPVANYQDLLRTAAEAAGLGSNGVRRLERVWHSRIGSRRPFTLWDIIDVVSWVATHDEEFSFQTRHALAIVSGELAVSRKLSKCPSCGRPHVTSTPSHA